MQCDQRPQGAAVIGPSCKVILRDHPNLWPSDDPQSGEYSRGGSFPRYVLQRPPEPLGERDTERVFRPLVNLAREQALGDPPQQNLARPASDLPGVGKSEAKVHDAGIEERAPC